MISPGLSFSSRQFYLSAATSLILHPAIRSFDTLKIQPNAPIYICMLHCYGCRNGQVVVGMCESVRNTCLAHTTAAPASSSDKNTTLEFMVGLYYSYLNSFSVRTCRRYKEVLAADQLPFAAFPFKEHDGNARNGCLPISEYAIPQLCSIKVAFSLQ